MNTIPKVRAGREKNRKVGVKCVGRRVTRVELLSLLLGGDFLRYLHELSIPVVS